MTDSLVSLRITISYCVAMVFNWPSAYMATASVLQMLLFLESIPSTPLNGSLQNVYRSPIEHYKEILLGIGPQKLPIFNDFATQWQL